MAADVAFAVQDLSQLARTLRKMGDEAAGALKDANRAAAERIVREALPNVPVRSGRLRDSVRALGGTTSAKMKAGTVRVPYAPAVHWGTGPRVGLRGPHNIARHAFLWDAREKLVAEVRDQYEHDLEQVLNRFTRGR